MQCPVFTIDTGRFSMCISSPDSFPEIQAHVHSCLLSNSTEQSMEPNTQLGPEQNMCFPSSQPPSYPASSPLSLPISGNGNSINIVIEAPNQEQFLILNFFPFPLPQSIPSTSFVSSSSTMLPKCHLFLSTLPLKPESRSASSGLSPDPHHHPHGYPHLHRCALQAAICREARELSKQSVQFSLPGAMAKLFAMPHNAFHNVVQPRS